MTPLRQAMRHAEEVLAASGDVEYTNIRTDALDLLVRFARTMLPVETGAPDDFNAWQDIIDAAQAPQPKV